MKFATLFTGGGLADIGAKQAGCEVLWGVEIDPQIAAIASKNLGHKVLVRSVLDVNPMELPRPDILSMSPPCTRASLNNMKKGESELDIAFAQKCLEFIQVLSPDSIILENVPGYAQFESWKILQSGLIAEGYWLDSRVYDAAIFDVPQSRKRFIARGAKGRFIPEMVGGDRRMGWRDSIEDLIPFFPVGNLAPFQQKRIKSEPAIGTLFWGDRNGNRTATLRHPSLPSPTVTVFNRPSAMPFFLDDAGWRQLSPRAIARLMTVPDWYELPCDIDDSPAARNLSLKILGNGVPCKFMQAIVESLT